jgi:hypothetical protein
LVPILKHINPILAPCPSILFHANTFQGYPAFHVYVFQVVSFPEPPFKPCLNLCSSPYVPHTRLAHCALFDYPNESNCGVHTMKLIVVQIVQLPCFFVPFNPTHFSEHLILEHPRPIFFPERER